jgi:predicted NAD-dependent protein-ADP-ribosyltransferase YbiA (DUF1768 family)
LDLKDKMEKDTLQFYAFSANKPAGKGVGDNVKDPSIYSELNKIENWRRMFSSLWEEEFVYEGAHYLSFEHCFQACKFNLTGHLDVGFKFTIESGCNLNASKSRRLVKLSEEKILLWEENKRNIKHKIYRAKFHSTSMPFKALLLTGNANLINAGPRIKKIHCTRLEELREELREELK